MNNAQSLKLRLGDVLFGHCANLVQDFHIAFLCPQELIYPIPESSQLPQQIGLWEFQRPDRTPILAY